jgi:transcriptional regulator with XRE-family HTH domain
MLKIKGIILKQALQNNGLRMEDAAKSLGISRQTLTAWCGRDKLSLDMIENVKTKLNIDLALLIEPAPVEMGFTPAVQEILNTKDQLIDSKNQLIEELKADKEKLFNLLTNKRD